MEASRKLEPGARLVHFQIWLSRVPSNAKRPRNANPQRHVPKVRSSKARPQSPPFATLATLSWSHRPPGLPPLASAYGPCRCHPTEASLPAARGAVTGKTGRVWALTKTLKTSMTFRQCRDMTVSWKPGAGKAVETAQFKAHLDKGHLSKDWMA